MTWSTGALITQNNACSKQALSTDSSTTPSSFSLHSSTSSSYSLLSMILASLIWNKWLKSTDSWSTLEISLPKSMDLTTNGINLSLELTLRKRPSGTKWRSFTRPSLTTIWINSRWDGPISLHQLRNSRVKYTISSNHPTGDSQPPNTTTKQSRYQYQLTMRKVDTGISFSHSLIIKPSNIRPQFPIINKSTTTHSNSWCHNQCTTTGTSRWITSRTSNFSENSMFDDHQVMKLIKLINILLWYFNNFTNM